MINGVNSFEAVYDMKSGDVDFERDIVKAGGLTIRIRELSKVDTMKFDFENVGLSFVYFDDGNVYFLYSDALAYTKLLKKIASSPKKVGERLRYFQNDYGVEHELWVQLLQHTLKKFNINQYSYADQCNIPCTSDYFSIRYGRCNIYPEKVDSIQDIHSLLYGLLPQNYGATRKKSLQKEFESEFERFKDICGAELENREAYSQYLENKNTENIDSWKTARDELYSVKMKVQQLAKEDVLDVQCSNRYVFFLDYCINFAHNRIGEINRNKLFQKYGPISDIKMSLRDCINKLGFSELFGLYKEYKVTEKLICSKARQGGMNPTEAPYKDYVDVYRLGSVLISDRMNQINKNKAKNKYILQDLLDEALIFYYDTDSAQEAYSARSNEKYTQDKESGDRGEQKVEYALKWLDQSYVRIERKSNDRVGDSCIYILNPEYVDEKQEYDHLVVSNKGIFVVETKNYTGKLIIDQYGNWIRKKNEKEEGVKNPLQQIRQHEKVLKSFLPQECDVISIICIANDKAIIEGSENCPIPIVKSDMLVEFIENWNGSNSIMTDLQKEKCIEAIYNYMV